MNPKRAARLRKMAEEIAVLKREHHIPSSDLYQYLKFRRLIDLLCSTVRLRSGGRIRIEMTEMEGLYACVEHSAARLLRYSCAEISYDLGFPIVQDWGDGEVSFQLNWQTPLDPLLCWASRVKDPDIPVVSVSPTAVIRAIVDSGGIYQPQLLALRLEEEGWLRLRHRGRTQLCTHEAFKEAVLSRRELLFDFGQVEVVENETRALRPQLFDELRSTLGREPEPLEVWKVVHREHMYDAQAEIYEPLGDISNEPSVWDNVTCEFDRLHERAQREQTTNRLWTQREILAAFFAKLGKGDLELLLAEAYRRAERRLKHAAYYRSLTGKREKSPEVERCEQLLHWIDQHEAWLRKFLVS